MDDSVAVVDDDEEGETLADECSEIGCCESAAGVVEEEEAEDVGSGVDDWEVEDVVSRTTSTSEDEDAPPEI